jgi:uncharacterized membrane protein YgcG
MAIVSQKRFLRGLNASVDVFSQPSGIVARVSNLIYQIRGALKTCDGSFILAKFNGVIQVAGSIWTEIFMFQPVGTDRYYVGICKDPTTQLGIVAGLTAVDGGAGGILPAATYYYVVTALDGAGGETVISAEANFVSPGGRNINLAWTAKVNATGYRLYRSTAPGAEVLVNSGTISSNAFVDGGSTVGTTTPPLHDTTQQCLFIKIVNPSYTAADILHTFPADNIPAPGDGGDGDGGGGGGGGDAGGGGGGGGGTPPGGGGGSGTGSGTTPAGGVSGNISPLPQLLQFVNKVILALGNGYPLYQFDGAATTAITNTFNALYPDWQAATAFAAGDTIKDSVSGYLFKATQGGITAAGRPAFPATLNATVSDNAIIWQNVGLYTGAPAPPGAAHAVVYAGSLWVFNTKPTATDIDGPSAIRMSDINNPNSWNPLNAAHLSKDDGSQGMGLALFTIAEQGIAPTGSLVAFKEFATFQIVGVFGSQNFSIQQAKTDLGCIAPRSIQFIPGYGIARLTHLGVAIFNGVGDQIISEEIRPYLFDNVDDDIDSMDWNFAYFVKASQTAVPPMYVMAIATQLPNLGVLAFHKVGSFPASSLPNGVYSFRAYGIDADGMEKSISYEYQFTWDGVTTLNTLRVGLPALPAGIVKWRVYFGLGSGLENQYVETTTTFVDISGPGTAGAPSRGVGGLTRLMCYDLVLKCWAIIDLPYAITVLRQFRYTGGIPVTVVGGMIDGTLRRIQAGDADWDGEAISWSFRTPEVYGEGGTQRVHYRRVVIRGVAEDPSTVMITPQYDGTDDVEIIPRTYQSGQNLFRADAELHIDAESANVTIEGTGRVEIDSVDWEVEPKPVGTPPIFS